MYFQVEDKWYRVQYLQSNDKKKTADVFKGALIDFDFRWNGSQVSTRKL